MRTNLNIAFEEKDVAKQNGARWDRDAKKWYLECESTQEISTRLDAIARTLGKKVEDIAIGMPKEFSIEQAKDYVNKMLALNGMKEGTFPDNKPEDAKTITGWLKEGYIPISLDVIKTYQYSGKENVGYQYIAKEDVKPMTDKEKQAYEEVAAERRKQASEKAKKTREEKKLQEKESTKKSPNQVVEKDTESKLDAYQSFIELKGLGEEFDKFYNKYYSKDAPVKNKKSNDKVFEKSSKKIKHLPNYEEIQGKKILCFDTETTGFSPSKGDELLQVAFVTLENGEIKTQFESFVKPHEKTSWTGAMIKNHISPKMVANAPYPEDLRDKVQEIVNKADVLVGYNIDFDINFLEQCMGIDFSNKIIADPSDYFRQNQPENQSFNLEACVTYYCTSEDLSTYKARAHKADTDAIATLKAFCNQAKIEGYDLRAISEKENKKFNNEYLEGEAR